MSRQQFHKLSGVQDPFHYVHEFCGLGIHQDRVGKTRRYSMMPQNSSQLTFGGFPQPEKALGQGQVCEAGT